MSTLPRGDLPPINFTEKTVTEIESSVIGTYEAVSGRSLADADPVRLFLEAIAAIIVNQRNIIDFSAKQNLLSYVSDEYVDYLAEFVGVKRLPAKAAVTTIRFTLSAPQDSVYTIPAGTMVTNGTVNFATSENLEIAIGAITGEVMAECTEAGTEGNNYLPGQLKTLVQPLPYIQTVTNISTTSGGSSIEGVESMVERIRLAPASFSVAGPKDAYVYWALTANSAIVDVAVTTPSAGVVDVRPLLENGTLPSQEVIDQVAAILSADDVRPITDDVQVLAPTVQNYALDVDYWISSDDASQALSIQSAVDTAVSEYVTWQKTKIGRDINPDELTARMKNAGAKRVVINSPSFTVVADTAVAQETGTTITYQGLENA